MPAGFHGAREGKRPFGRPSRRQEYNIKVDLQEIGMMWTGLMSFRRGTRGKLL
jgi:hypothetical protein